MWLEIKTIKKCEQLIINGAQQIPVFKMDGIAYQNATQF